MPIIGNVGRRSFKVRFLNTLIHTALVCGAVTMLYPFALMLSGSLKSNIDDDKLDVIPEFLYSDDMLYTKWMEAKYNETLSVHNLAYREKSLSFDHCRMVETPVRQRFDDWEAFLAATPEIRTEMHTTLGNSYARGVRPEVSRRFLASLKAEPDVTDDITTLNRKYATTFVNWDNVTLPLSYSVRRNAALTMNPYEARIYEFGLKQDPANFIYYSIDSYFAEQVLRPRYGQRIEQVNKALGTHYKSWSDMTIPRTVPEGPLREDWLFFVRQRLHLHFVRVAPEALPDYQAYLKDRYKDIALLNTRYEPKTPYTGFAEVPLIEEPPRVGEKLADWDYFINSVVKDEHLRIISTEWM